MSKSHLFIAVAALQFIAAVAQAHDHNTVGTVLFILAGICWLGSAWLARSEA